MKKFKANVAISIDGGGLRGAIIAKALTDVESFLGKKFCDICTLFVGTSTGSIISTALYMNFTAETIYNLYIKMGKIIFPKSLRSILWPIFTYRYSNKNLIKELKLNFNEAKFSNPLMKKNLVIVIRDLVENRSRFIKNYKKKYSAWKIWKVVTSSCTVPTYFPVFEGRYVDGGFGSYSNPVYIAAYEIKNCLKWDLSKTTLISIGSGRTSDKLNPYQANKFISFGWIKPMLDTFLDCANDEQVKIVKDNFPGLDFRRFQIDIQNIEMDDPSKMDFMKKYGEELGKKILHDKWE